MKEFNIYKFISHVFIVAFFVLATIQTVFEMNVFIAACFGPQVFAYAVLASSIPITFLLLLMEYPYRKTKNVSFFISKNIKRVFKVLLYIIILSSFIIWSGILISAVGVICFTDIQVSLRQIGLFMLNRFGFAAIYSLIIVWFFYGLADLNFLKKKKLDE